MMACGNYSGRRLMNCLLTPTLVPGRESASGHNDSQAPRLERNLDRGRAHILAIGVDIEWSPGFEPYAGCLVVLHLGNREMPSKIHGRKQAKESKLRQLPHDADVELPVVEHRPRGHLHASSIGRSIGTDGYKNPFLAPGLPPLPVDGQNPGRNGLKARQRGQEAQQVAAMGAQPARKTVRASRDFSVKTNPAGTAEVARRHVSGLPTTQG